MGYSAWDHFKEEINKRRTIDGTITRQSLLNELGCTEATADTYIGICLKASYLIAILPGYYHVNYSIPNHKTIKEIREEAYGKKNLLQNLV